ncbi:MAG: hypothetical protein QXR64_00590 [Pyrobaculum sp.]
MGMTVVEQTQKQVVREEEERRPPFVILLLGAVAVLSFFFGVLTAPVFGIDRSTPPLVPVLFVGVNGSGVFSIEAPPGSFVYTPVKLCNAAESDVAAAVSIEAPGEVRVFAVHVGDVWFGKRWGESKTFTIRLGPGQCIDGRVEILIDGKTPPDRQIIVKIESRVD